MIELEQMQMWVAQMQVQNEEFMFSPKRQAVGSGAAPEGGSRLREDFVPACDEDDVERWMRDRHVSGGCGIATSWRDCATLWRVQQRVCHRYQIRQWSRTQSGVMEEVHQCDRTELWDLGLDCAGFDPGPKKRRRRVMSSPDLSDSDLSFLDGFERSLFSRVGWRWHADPPRHHVGGREWQAPPPLNMTIDDCDEEVSGGVPHVDDV